jgi:hypothetical protein
MKQRVKSFNDIYNESTKESIDELDRSTLASYVNKASDAKGHRNLSTQKLDKRYAGVASASKKLDKMSKENLDPMITYIAALGNSKASVFPTNEDIETLTSNYSLAEHAKHILENAQGLGGEVKIDVTSHAKRAFDQGAGKSTPLSIVEMKTLPGRVEIDSANNSVEVSYEKIYEGLQKAFDAGQQYASADNNVNAMNAYVAALADDKNRSNSLSEMVQGKTYTQKQLMDKINTGKWEATHDIKPGKHVEMRHQSGKRVMVHVKEEVEVVERVQKPYGVGMTDELSVIQQVLEKKLTPAEMKKREEIAQAMERENPGMDKSKKMAIATATAKRVAEETHMEDMHYCAKHVYSERFGEGFVVEGSHAEPDENGLIEWYDVDFGGTVRRVMTEKVKVMHAEYHMNHKKKKMSEEDDEDEMNEAKNYYHKLADRHMKDANSEGATEKQKDHAMKMNKRALAAAKLSDRDPVAAKKLYMGVSEGYANFTSNAPLRMKAAAASKMKGTHPQTDKEKDLAAAAEPKDKITHKDILVKRGVIAKEEAEQIDELKRDTLKSYMDKATTDFGHQNFGRRVAKGDDKAEFARKEKLRQTGIAKASARMNEEEAEQIDELSKETMKSYQDKVMARPSSMNTTKTINGMARSANKMKQKQNEEFELAESVSLDEETVVHGKYTISSHGAMSGIPEGQPSHVTGHISKLKSLGVPHEKGGKYGSTVRVSVKNNETGDTTHHHVYQRDFQSSHRPVVSVRDVGVARKNQAEHESALKDYLSGKKPTTKYSGKVSESNDHLEESMISYSDFQSKLAAHKKAGNKIVDDKYDDKKATYTVVDKEGVGKKITHTPAGMKQSHIGQVERADDEEDNTTEKRGRGRPAGSKSGARH